jgi:hypothetical protein
MRCANCRHPEVDHHGLSCGAYDETSYGYERCKCDGFVPQEIAKDLQESGGSDGGD